MHKIIEHACNNQAEYHASVDTQSPFLTAQIWFYNRTNPNFVEKWTPKIVQNKRVTKQESLQVFFGFTSPLLCLDLMYTVQRVAKTTFRLQFFVAIL